MNIIHNLTMRMRNKSRRNAIASILYYSRNFRNGKVNKNEPVFSLPERISYRRGKRGEATRAPDVVKVAKTAPRPATKRPNVMKGPTKPATIRPRYEPPARDKRQWTDIYDTPVNFGIEGKLARLVYNSYTRTNFHDGSQL